MFSLGIFPVVAFPVGAFSVGTLSLGTLSFEVLPFLGRGSSASGLVRGDIWPPSLPLRLSEDVLTALPLRPVEDMQTTLPLRPGGDVLTVLLLRSLVVDALEDFRGDETGVKAAALGDDGIARLLGNGAKAERSDPKALRFFRFHSSSCGSKRGLLDLLVASRIEMMSLRRPSIVSCSRSTASVSLLTLTSKA